MSTSDQLALVIDELRYRCAACDRMFAPHWMQDSGGWHHKVWCLRCALLDAQNLRIGVLEENVARWSTERMDDAEVRAVGEWRRELEENETRIREQRILKMFDRLPSPMGSAIADAMEFSLQLLVRELAQWPDDWSVATHGTDGNPHVWFPCTRTYAGTPTTPGIHTVDDARCACGLWMSDYTNRVCVDGLWARMGGVVTLD